MVYVGRKDVVTTATRIVCKACGANTDKKYTEASAIYCWNTRKPMEQIVERLDELQQPCYECRESCNEKCVIERAIEIVKEVINK